jgi:hypothetical protein
LGFYKGICGYSSCFGVYILLFLFVDFAAGCVFGEHPKALKIRSDDLMLVVDLMENGSDQ